MNLHISISPSPLWGEGRGEGVPRLPHVRHTRNPLTLTLSPEGRGNGVVA